MAEGKGLCGDEQIIAADRFAGLLEAITEPSVDAGRRAPRRGGRRGRRAPLPAGPGGTAIHVSIVKASRTASHAGHSPSTCRSFTFDSNEKRLVRPQLGLVLGRDAVRGSWGEDQPGGAEVAKAERVAVAAHGEEPVVGVEGLGVELGGEAVEGQDPDPGGLGADRGQDPAEGRAFEGLLVREGLERGRRISVPSASSIVRSNAAAASNVCS